MKKSKKSIENIQEISKKIADEVCLKINEVDEEDFVKKPEIEYWRQAILETVIEILEKRV